MGVYISKQNKKRCKRIRPEAMKNALTNFQPNSDSPSLAVATWTDTVFYKTLGIVIYGLALKSSLCVSQVALITVCQS